MADGYVQGGPLGGEPRCGFEGTLGGEHCGEKSEVFLGGLWLCGRHADRLRLRERAAYWRAVLAHVDLWSGEARRRGRGDVVGLLRAERAGASAALEGASAALQRNREGPEGEVDGPDDEHEKAPQRRPPLLLLGLPVAGRPPEGF